LRVAKLYIVRHIDYIAAHSTKNGTEVVIVNGEIFHVSSLVKRQKFIGLGVRVFSSELIVTPQSPTPIFFIRVCTFYTCEESY
jgi:hypothetical protein